MINFTFSGSSLLRILLVIVPCMWNGLYAQISLTVINDPDKTVDLLEFETLEFLDSADVRDYLFNTINTLRKEGYLLSNVDSLYGKFPDLHAVLHIGGKYELTSLKFLNIPEEIQNKLRNKPKKYLKETFQNEEVEELLEEIISYSENNGYPFAKVKLDSVRVIASTLNAQLFYQPGPLITFDSVHLSSDLVKSKFLTAHLGIVPGKYYDQRIIDQIPTRLEHLKYLNLKQTRITFSNEECQVHLSFTPVKSNRLDGFLGIFPNAAEGKNILITGKLDLQFRNLFKSGKSLDLFWEKQQVATQSLIVNYLHPNLFASPLGLLAGIDLYKQDTSFINRNLKFGFNFLTKNITVSAFADWETSRTIGNSPPYMAEIVDFNLNNFGMRLTNYRDGISSSIRQTWGADIGGTIGNKFLVNINDNDSLSVTLEPESIQYSFDAKLSGQFHLARSWFVYGRVTVGKMVNDQLFLNDLFRLGGLKTIRGFNENEFYASEFITATTEVRYFFAERSNLVLFFDIGNLSYSLIQEDYSDQPFGFGIGTNVETNAGILSLNYAVGKSSEQPLDLKFSKIHIGYIASF